MAACPICGKQAGARAQNPAFPFCSSQCKMVDLGKWLNEDYRVPVEDSPAEVGDGSTNGKNGGGEA